MTKTKRLSIQIEDLSRRVSGLYATTDFLSKKIDSIERGVMRHVIQGAADLCRTNLELRLLMAHLGLKVEWDEKKDELVVKKINKNISRKNGTPGPKLRIKG